MEEIYYSEEEEPKMGRKIKPDQASTEFVFPPEEMRDLIFSSPENFKTYILAYDNKKAKLFKYNVNKIYFYAMCKHCSVKISYRKEADGYTCFKF